MKIKLNDVFSSPSLFLVTGCGVGLLPIAPGTYGSILGMLFFLALAHLYLPILWLSFIIIIFYLISYIAVQSALKIIQRPDPGEIVIDEILGMMVVMMMIPPRSKVGVLCFFII